MKYAMPVEVARCYGALSMKVRLLQLAGNTEESILGCLSQSSVAKNPEISITSFQIKKQKTKHHKQESIPDYFHSFKNTIAYNIFF